MSKLEIAPSPVGGNPDNPIVLKNGKHLVLDLDETLVHTFGEEDSLFKFLHLLPEKLQKRLFEVKLGVNDSMFTFIRPGVEEFLETAFKEFDTVSVWSAGTYDYVHKIVDIVFTKQRPYFIMVRRDCNELSLGYNNSLCRYKPLEIIYARHKTHNESNTIIIDDRQDICALNCMNNIQLPEFHLHWLNYEELLINPETKDRSLKLLSDWFKTESFRNTKDVRLLKRRSPFTV